MLVGKRERKGTGNIETKGNWIRGMGRRSTGIGREQEGEILRDKETCIVKRERETEKRQKILLS